jgi:hypothetical protein
MGIFDFLRKKETPLEDKNQIIPLDEKFIHQNQSQSIVPFIGKLLIPENVRQLLWVGDGPFKNYNPENDKKILFENELFRVTFSFHTEPSLVFFSLPVDHDTNTENVEKLGYYPSYDKLNPQQRFVYLKWLCDITKPVDIGYVFIFYYGLERHLVSGKYSDAINTILTLRQHHKHPSFLSYSANALVLSAILHKDKETLVKVLDLIDDTSYCSSIVLLGKFLMHLDLIPAEIITISSAVGFKNQKYIKEYPDLFKKTLESNLIKEFGKNSYPIYQLKMQYPSHQTMSFANISFDQEIRSPLLPDILQSPEFSSSIKTILTTTHNEVKQSLAEMRKSGSAPQPIIAGFDSTGPKPECPYCHNLWEKMPTGNKKCPACKKTVIVRTDPVEKKKILLREDQLEEFEKKLKELRNHKTIQRILANLNVEISQFDQTKENLKMKSGKEPTDNDAILEIIDQVGYHHFKNLDMGLFRNTILDKCEIFKSSGDMKNALISYLELCYIDLNGPNNCGSSKNHPDSLKKYPPFNPNDTVLATPAPGIIKYIIQITKELNLTKDQAKEIFISHNSKVEKARKLPLSVQNAWVRLEPVITSLEVEDEVSHD